MESMTGTKIKYHEKELYYHIINIDMPVRLCPNSKRRDSKQDCEMDSQDGHHRHKQL